MSSGIIRWW